MLVVGTGLIGTSVGLALRTRGHAVWLSDTNPAHIDVAVRMNAGRPHHGEAVELVVVAVPPPSAAGVVAEHLLASTEAAVTDTCSVKAPVMAELRDLMRGSSAGGDTALQRYVGGHPIAGRERGGPEQARADLFAHAAWVLTPAEQAGAAALDAVHWLVAECGAVAVAMSEEDHDAALALTSHVPQLVSSALAAQLAGAPDSLLALAGPGLRGMLRLASSDPELWSGIVASNRAHIAGGLESLAATLTSTARTLREDDNPAAAVHALLVRGGQGALRVNHETAAGRSSANG